MATHHPPRDVLVFRSARPGASFETWLFQKLDPSERRSVAAAITTCGPPWRPHVSAPGIARRHGPGLFEARVHLRQAPRRLLATQRYVRGRVEALGVFFLWTDAGPIILSAGLEMLDFRGLPKNLGLGAARHKLRELRALEARGYVERRLVPYTFFEIRRQCRVGRLIAWDKERQAGLTAFEDVRELVRQEAEAEGVQALVELQVEEDRRRIGFTLAALRAEREMTQVQVAERAGLRQPVLSEIESGVANPTLATLSALAQALGGRLDVDGEGVTSLPGAPPARSRAPRR